MVIKEALIIKKIPAVFTGLFDFVEATRVSVSNENKVKIKV